MAFLISLDDRYEQGRLAAHLPQTEGRPATDLTSVTLDRLRSYRELSMQTAPSERVLVPVGELEVLEAGPPKGALFLAIPDLEGPIYGVPDRSSFLQITHQLRQGERMVYSSVLHYWSLLSLPSGTSLPERRQILDLDATAPCITTFAFQEEPGSPYWLPVLESAEPVKLNLTAFDSAIRIGLARAAVSPYGVQDPEAIQSVVSTLDLVALPTRPGGRIEWIADIATPKGVCARRCTLTTGDVQAAVNAAWKALEADDALPGKSSLLIVSRWAPWLQGKGLNIQAPDHEAFITRFAELRALGLPLYLKNLDLIEFRVLNGRTLLTINVCSPTPVREGQKLTFEGKTAQGQRLFEMDEPVAYFPVFINGKQDMIGGKPAVLTLHAPEAGSVTVSIRFVVTVGQRLKIEVTDQATQKPLKNELVAQSQIVKPSVKCLTWAEIQDGRRERNRTAHDRFITSGAFHDVQRAASKFARILEGSPPTKVSSRVVQDVLSQLDSPLRQLEATLRLPPRPGERQSSANDILLGYTVPPADKEGPWDREIRSAMEHASGLNLLASWLPALMRSDAAFRYRNTLLRAITQVGRLYGAGQYVGISPATLPAVGDAWDAFAKEQILMAKARLSTGVEDQLEILNGLKASLSTGLAEAHSWSVSRVLLWHCNFEATIQAVDPADMIQGLVNVGLAVQARTGDDEYRLKQNVFLSLIFLMTYAEQDQMLGFEGAPEMVALKKLLEAYRMHSRIILRQVDASISLADILRDILVNKDLGQGIRAGLLRLA